MNITDGKTYEESLTDEDRELISHQQPKTWQDEFDNFIKSNSSAFLIDVRETIKYFISTKKSEWEKDSFERGVREAIKLSDEIEAKSPTSPMEEWKAFKQFRNTLREKFNL